MSIKQLPLHTKERSLFQRLSTPIKIQDYLDTVPMNWEKHGETYHSPRLALQAKKMHCFEGALFAAAALWWHGQPPLLFDLRVTAEDEDHVVALYQRNGYWGAISKTNHATVRFRDPIYKTLRELALSYFHEYFSNTTGNKVLREYSARPFRLTPYGTAWITTTDDLHFLAQAVDDAAHRSLVLTRQLRYLRPADRMELQAGRLQDWKRSNPRT